MSANVPSSSNMAQSTQSRSQGFWNAVSKLGVKLPLMVILLLALAFAISTSLSIQATRTALTETLQGELTAQADTKSELIRTNLVATRNMAIDLAAAAEVSAYDRTTIMEMIKNTLKRNDQIYGSTIAYEPYQFESTQYYWAPYYSRASGLEPVFTQLGNPEYDYFKWDWYTLPKKSLEPVLSPPYFDAGGGNIWMVTWSVPFFNTKTGEFKGVATADIAFSQLQAIVSSIRVGQNGYAFLLDPNGTILGISETGGKYLLMRDKMTGFSQTPQTQEWEKLIKNMLAQQSGFTSATDLQGRPMFVAYTPIGIRTGWSLGLAYPQEELFEKTSALQRSQMIYASIVAIVLGVILYLFTLSITQPVRRLTRYATRIATAQGQLTKSELVESIDIRTRDELEDLAEAFNQMAKTLASSFETLEQKVVDRTQALERSSLEFELIAEVARDITIIRDLDTLLNVSANLIRERFGYYHVGVFLLDDRSEYAVLRAASSSAALQMIEQNHKLRMGQGLVGNVVRTGQAHIALDTGKDAVHFQNPLLPLTRSEIALPLNSRSVTIGALDIQAEAEAAFDERDTKILQLLADQLAAAIENAELAKRVESTFIELNKTYRVRSRQAWQVAIEERKHPAYEYDGLQTRALSHLITEDDLKQLEHGKPVVVQGNGNSNESKIKATLMVPLMALNQMIGVIGVEQENPDHEWTAEDIALVESAANRAALSLENARLIEESQRRAEKERAIFEASKRIGSVSNMENILHVTAEEIERVLRGSEVILQFSDRRKS